MIILLEWHRQANSQCLPIPCSHLPGPHFQKPCRFAAASSAQPRLPWHSTSLPLPCWQGEKPSTKPGTEPRAPVTSWSSWGAPGENRVPFMYHRLQALISVLLGKRRSYWMCCSCPERRSQRCASALMSTCECLQAPRARPAPPPKQPAVLFVCSNKCTPNPCSFCKGL